MCLEQVNSLTFDVVLKQCRDILKNKFKRRLAIDKAVDLRKRGVKFLNKHLRPLLNLFPNSFQV